MFVGLLPLLPRSIDFRKRKFRLLKDRHIYDTEVMATTDTTKSFFVSIGTKKKSQAIFTGDFSLVKEANLYLVMQLQAFVRDRILPKVEYLPFFGKGSFQWNVIVPETVTVDEDRLHHISQGPSATGDTDADERQSDASPRYEARRSYLVGANKIVPGGRAIEFNCNWQETGGSGLSTTTDLSVIFAGGEYEPGNPSN
jgi:hypothetical protein